VSIACEFEGTAQRLRDGEWHEVPCDPSSPWVCWTHKMRHLRGAGGLGRQLSGGRAFTEANKGGYTQREIMMENIAQAAADGVELERAR
jgi:hypothetical protein